MKGRKKTALIAIERRNAFYNKTIQHNMVLSQKNTELSFRINDLQNALEKAYKIINKKKWWQFWKWFN